MRITLQPAYLLHHRPYRDSSRICDFFTLDYGRISLVANGVWRKERGGSLGNLISPFIPLLISAVGRGNLRTMIGAELAGKSFRLQGERIFCGLYINELLLKLINRDDPYPELFSHYVKIIDELSGSSKLESLLRSFELCLLRVLGYEIDLNRDSFGKMIDCSKKYHYKVTEGFVRVSGNSSVDDNVFCGSEILAIANGEFDLAPRKSKRLLRETLQYHLGDKVIQSREFFVSAKKE